MNEEGGSGEDCIPALSSAASTIVAGDGNSCWMARIAQLANLNFCVQLRQHIAIPTVVLRVLYDLLHHAHPIARLCVDLVAHETGRVVLFGRYVGRS